VAGETGRPVERALGGVARARLPATGGLDVEVAGDDPGLLVEVQARTERGVEVTLVFHLAERVPHVRVDRPEGEPGLHARQLASAATGELGLAAEECALEQQIGRASCRE